VFNIGPEEIILILVVALVFLGPNRLPEVARQIGKGVREFRSLSTRARQELLDNVNLQGEAEDLAPLELDPPSLPNGKTKKVKAPKDTVALPTGLGADGSVEGDIPGIPGTVEPMDGVRMTQEATVLADAAPGEPTTEGPVPQEPAPAEAEADPMERSG
jgi:Tat protein translocase TatB subunit